jgi:hypothetical protein
VALALKKKSRSSRLRSRCAADPNGTPGWRCRPPDLYCPPRVIGDIVIVVHKASRTLDLYRGRHLLRRYSVALGPHPVGRKEREGDGRTPAVSTQARADSSWFTDCGTVGERSVPTAPRS